MDVLVPPEGVARRLTEATPGDGARGPDARPDDRTPWAATLYPFVIAVLPALFAAAAGGGQFDKRDLLRIVLALLAFAAAAFALCLGLARLVRRRDLFARAALLATVVVAWVMYAIPLGDAVTEAAPALARAQGHLVLLAAASAVVVWAALRRRAPNATAAKALTLASALVVCSTGVTLLRNLARGRPNRVAQSAMWQLVQRPVAVNPALARPGPKHDVYLVILDGYPNAAVLRAKFGFDNTPFLDSLRALGFTVPARARSNYTMTVLSLASLLSFEHDTLLARDLAPTDGDQSIPNAVIRYNRTARFLKDRGYHFRMYGPHVYASRSTPLAEYSYAGPGRRPPGVAFRATELRKFVFSKTLFSKLAALRRVDAGALALGAFRELHDVPARPELTFTMAHFMMPHQPTVLDRDCRPINPAADVVGENVTLPGTREVYLGAVQCANRQVLSLAAAMLRRSAVPPIVVVIGDHGSLSNGWPRATGRPIDESAAERLAPLAAFYLPDGGAALVRDSVTHVNIFRHVLRYYFGADLPPLGNDAFFSQGGETYLFRPVDERVVLGG